MEKLYSENPKLMPFKKRIGLEVLKIQEKAVAEEDVPLSGSLNQDKSTSLTKKLLAKSTISENLLPPKKRLSYKVLHEEDNEPTESNITNNNDDSSDNNDDNRDKDKNKKMSLRRFRVGAVDDEQNSKQKKKQKRQVPSLENPADQQYSPADDDKRINCYDKVWTVIMKTLNNTDADNHQACLSIPKSEVLSDFLSKKEEEFLGGVDKKGNRCKIAVKVRGCNSVMTHNMCLTRWDYHQNKGWKYVLNRGWNTLRRESGLEVGDEICVVASRSKYHGSLCLTIYGGKKLVNWGNKCKRS